MSKNSVDVLTRLLFPAILTVNSVMPVIDKTQITRLENESKRFAKEIEQKQQENLLLREQVFSIRSQIEESQKIYEDISKVSHDRIIPRIDQERDHDAD